MQASGTDAQAAPPEAGELAGLPVVLRDVGTARLRQSGQDVAVGKWRRRLLRASLSGTGVHRVAVVKFTSGLARADADPKTDLITQSSSGHRGWQGQCACGDIDETGHQNSQLGEPIQGAIGPGLGPGCGPRPKSRPMLR